jgi:hypothetical protein
MKRPRIMPPVYLLAAIAAMVALHFLLPDKQLLRAPWRWAGAVPIVEWLHVEGGKLDHRRFKRGSQVRAAIRVGAQPMIVWATPKADRRASIGERSAGSGMSLGSRGHESPTLQATSPACAIREDFDDQSRLRRIARVATTTRRRLNDGLCRAPVGTGRNPSKGVVDLLADDRPSIRERAIDSHLRSVDAAAPAAVILAGAAASWAWRAGLVPRIAAGGGLAGSFVTPAIVRRLSIRAIPRGAAWPTCAPYKCGCAAAGADLWRWPHDRAESSIGRARSRGWGAERRAGRRAG